MACFINTEMIEMEVAQAQAYEQRKLQLKEKRMSQQITMAEGGRVVPDGASDAPRLYMPGRYQYHPQKYTHSHYPSNTLSCHNIFSLIPFHPIP